MSAASLFPCPFCRSSAVVVTSTTRAFSHYRCGTCAEVWTGQTSRPQPLTAAADSDLTEAAPAAPATH